MRDDTTSGLGGEFEIVLRQDGKYIDALVDCPLQEIDNYERIRNVSAPKTLEVGTYNANGTYTFRQDLSHVRIRD